MKKLIIVISSLLITLSFIGCSIKSSARTPVETYLTNYQVLSNSVLADMKKIIDSENLNDKQKQIYEEIMKKEYSNLEYEILNEKYNGDEAVVTVKITVYDLYKASKEAKEYLQTNYDKFYENGIFSNSLYLDYKLEKMNEVTDKINYTIDFYVEREDNTWKLNEITNDDLEKIHGIYNYDET